MRCTIYDKLERKIAENTIIILLELETVMETSWQKKRDENKQVSSISVNKPHKLWNAIKNNTPAPFGASYASDL